MTMIYKKTPRTRYSNRTEYVLWTGCEWSCEQSDLLCWGLSLDKKIYICSQQQQWNKSIYSEKAIISVYDNDTGEVLDSSIFDVEVLYLSRKTTNRDRRPLFTIGKTRFRKDSFLWWSRGHSGQAVWVSRLVDMVRTRDRAQSLTTVVVISSIFVFITLTTTFIVAVVCCKRNAVFALQPHRGRRRQSSARRSSRSTYSPDSGSRDCEHCEINLL